MFMLSGCEGETGDKVEHEELPELMGDGGGDRVNE